MLPDSVLAEPTVSWLLGLSSGCLLLGCCSARWWLAASLLAKLTATARWSATRWANRSDLDSSSCCTAQQQQYWYRKAPGGLRIHYRTLYQGTSARLCTGIRPTATTKASWWSVLRLGRLLSVLCLGCWKLPPRSSCCGDHSPSHTAGCCTCLATCRLGSHLLGKAAHQMRASTHHCPRSSRQPFHSMASCV